MKNKRGEVSTVVILGTIFVIVLAVFLTNITRQRNITNTRATEGSCRNNPVAPLSGYVWVANCSGTCNTNSDCPRNTSDPSNVNPETSNWCYQFIEASGPVNKCLQLQKAGTTNPTSTQVPEAPIQTPTTAQSFPTSTPVPSSTLPPTPTPTTRSISDLTRGNITPIPTATPISISDKTRGNTTPTPTMRSISDRTRGNATDSKIIKVDTELEGKACTGNPDADYGCIDVYGFYLN